MAATLQGTLFTITVPGGPLTLPHAPVGAAWLTPSSPLLRQCRSSVCRARLHGSLLHKAFSLPSAVISLPLPNCQGPWCPLLGGAGPS